MFTGIITDIGQIIEIDENGDLQVKISCNYDLSTIFVGASIAHNGICLTVTNKGTIKNKPWYSIDVSAETIKKTNILLQNSKWQIGTQINLERSLKVGDELGGHIVTGHVDGIATIREVKKDGGSTKITLETQIDLATYIATKGSIALNGTSLTVNNIRNNQFDINLIPHTKKYTTWNNLNVGDNVNLEIDSLARYVARIKEAKH